MLYGLIVFRIIGELFGLRTSLDEKAVATLKEIKKRYKLTAKELQDVGKAIKEVGNQLGDIDDAIKGKTRKGRKKSVK